MKTRKSWRPAVGLLFLLAAGGGQRVEAACANSRAFDSAFASVYVAYDYARFTASGFFWALGAGSPVDGAGIDNATYPPYYWTPYFIGGNWNHPAVDGCIDTAGDGPALDGDECMVVAYSDQRDGKGYFAVLTTPARPSETPPFRFASDGRIDLARTLRPSHVASDADGDSVAVTWKLDSALPFGTSLDPACTNGVVAGYRIFAKGVAPGASAPSDVAITAGWAEVSPSTPLGDEATVQLSCTSGADTYLGAVLDFDSGFSTVHVSQPARAILTATDGDGDGTPDACDPCTDTDDDGFGDPGRPSSTCTLDNCPASMNADQSDGDFDHVGDACDECPGRADPLPRMIADLGQSADQRLTKLELTPSGLDAIFLARLFSSAVELYRAPVHGGGASRLNPPLVEGGSVRDFRVSPSSTRVVYVADQESPDVLELYSVAAPLWALSATKLTAPMPPGGDVWINPASGRTLLEIAPGGQTVVYIASQEAAGRRELFAVPIDGSAAPVKLNAPIPAGTSVDDFAISPDGSRAVYRVSGHPALDEIFSVPISGGAAIRLNSQHDVDVRRFVLSPDGTRVVYELSGQNLVSVPITGGSVTRLHEPPEFAVRSFAVSPDSAKVVFIADQFDFFTFELFSVEIDGGPLVQLNPPHGAAVDFQIAPDAATVVYRFEESLSDPTELFTVPIGGGASTRLNDTVFGFGVLDFEIDSASRRVVYRASQTTAGVIELYSVPVEGGGSVRLNGPLVAGGNVQADANGNGGSFAVTPDGTTVVYRADQEIDGLYELYAVAIGGGRTFALHDPWLSEGIVDRFFSVATTSDRAVYLAAPGLFATPLLPGRDGDADGLVNSCDSCTDADGDGVGDPGYATSNCGVDNCPEVANATQADLDGDGAGDGCDCAPADPAARRPGSPWLSVGRSETGTRLSWTAVVGADTYSVTRGSLTGLPASDYGPCLVTAISGFEFVDAQTPFPGAAFTYLVQGSSASCGLGPLGFTTHDGERTNINNAACF